MESRRTSERPGTPRLRRTFVLVHDKPRLPSSSWWSEMRRATTIRLASPGRKRFGVRGARKLIPYRSQRRIHFSAVHAPRCRPVGRECPVDFRFGQGLCEPPSSVRHLSTSIRHRESRPEITFDRPRYAFATRSGPRVSRNTCRAVVRFFGALRP
jgi:hypothetical protein